MNKSQNIKKITTISILISLSVVFSLVDKFISSGICALVPLLGTLVPNFKLGIANIIILLILLNYNFKISFISVTLKIVIVGLFNPGGIFMSMGGSYLSFFVMYFLIRLLKNNKYIYIISATGGFMHSLGQIICGFLYYGLINFDKGDLNIFIYSPFILIMGFLTGIVVGIITKTLNIKLKLIENEKGINL